MTEEVLPTLLQILKRQATPAGWEWLEKALDSVSASPSESRLLAAYTSTTRQLGRQPVELLSFPKWRLDDLGRAALLLAIAGTSGDSFEKLAGACYEMGDSSEQESWLRGLNLLPGSERFVEMAIDACRTNILPLFESIACENPYPCRNFPELNFNQMVMKGVFNGTSLSRIAGLQSRFSRELSRMADDYVSEREAAGREVPVDIWLVIAPKVDADGLSRVQRYLKHENPQHRHWAEVGLSHRKD